MSDTPVKNKAKVKKAKAVTVVNAKEIKAWLRGIQEFAPAGWTPTPEQWATVCEKIFLLDESEGYASNDTTSYSYAEQPRQYQEVAYTAVTPSYAAIPQDSALAGTSVAGTPATPGKLATSRSPTESGMVPVTSATEVLEGEYKSPF